MSDNKLSLAEKMAAAAKEGAAKAAAEAPKAPQKEEKKGHYYQGNHVKRLVMANGTIVLPDEEGFFVPKTQEEYDMLEHLAASPTCSLEKLD